MSGTIRQRYMRLLNEVFAYEYHVPDPSLAPVLSAVPLIKNGVTLLTGTYGTGKTTLVEALARRLFVDDGSPSLGRIRCHQELMDTDTLYSISFANPDAPAKPRKFLSARFRYINELPRSNPAWQNALLSFFSEGSISFRDQTFAVSPGVNFCDRNPDDIGQDGVVRALLDRVDHEIIIPDHSYRPRVSMPEKSEAPLSSDEMEQIWQQVGEIRIGESAWDFAHMVNQYFSSCLRPRSIANRLFELPCEECAHRNEVCNKLRSTPGQRALNSMISLARAFAWLRGGGEVSIQDIEQALPYTYAHRLDFHHEVFREWPNPQVYLREHVVGGHLEAKKERWLSAIAAKQANEPQRVLQIARETDDLVVAWLYTHCSKRQFSTEEVVA